MASLESKNTPLMEKTPEPEESPENTHHRCCTCEHFKNMKLGTQICITVSSSLAIVFIILFVVIIVNLKLSNTYSTLDNKINQIYAENLLDLGRETAATMGVYHNVSQSALAKINLILSDILEVPHVSQYPLDWTQVEPLSTWSSSVESTAVESANLANQKVSFEHMT